MFHYLVGSAYCLQLSYPNNSFCFEPFCRDCSEVESEQKMLEEVCLIYVCQLLNFVDQKVDNSFGALKTIANLTMLLCAGHQ